MKGFKFIVATSIIFCGSQTSAYAGNSFSDQYGSLHVFGKTMLSQSDCVLAQINSKTLSLVDDYQNLSFPGSFPGARGLHLSSDEEKAIYGAIITKGCSKDLTQSLYNMMRTLKSFELFGKLLLVGTYGGLVVGGGGGYALGALYNQVLQYPSTPSYTAGFTDGFTLAVVGMTWYTLPSQLKYSHQKKLIKQTCMKNGWECEMDPDFTNRTLQNNLNSFFTNYQYIVNNNEETSSWYAAADLNLDTVVETSPSDRSAYANKLKGVKEQQEDASREISKLLNAYTEINKQSLTQELKTALQFEQFADLQDTQNQIKKSIESIQSEISNNSNWIAYKKLEEATNKLCESEIESGEYKSDYESQSSDAKEKLERYKSFAKDLSTNHSISIERSCTSYISKLNTKAKYAPTKPVKKSYSSSSSYTNSTNHCDNSPAGRYCCDNANAQYKVESGALGAIMRGMDGYDAYTNAVEVFGCWFE